MPIFRYSRITKGNLVFFSGIVDDSESRTFEQQFLTCLEVLDKRLKANGISKGDLVNVTVWLANIEKDFEQLNHLWVKAFDGRLGPPRSTCEVKLSRKALMVEICAIAQKRRLPKITFFGRR